jgi:probable HAF family extracellular repeat protein
MLTRTKILVHLAAAVAAGSSSRSLCAQTCADLVHIGGGNLTQGTDVSADGSVVVGRTTIITTQGRAAFRWTAATGIETIGSPGWGSIEAANAISADGLVVVGVGGCWWPCAFRWTAATGTENLGFGTAHGVNADGSVVVGTSYHVSGHDHAFRWTAATGMRDLGTMGNSLTSVAYGVSADGSVVVGKSGDSIASAFRWTAATGMQDLGTLGGALGSSTVAYDVNADGTVVVGTSRHVSGHDHAFRWTAATGMQDLGTLGGNASGAKAVSADGTVVVGWAATSSGSRRAFRWTEPTGMSEVFAPGVTDTDAVSLSAGGSVVVGNSAYDTFRLESSIMGSTYCRPSVSNSTGCGGIVIARGNPLVSVGALQLTASSLPANSFGLLLTSRTPGFSSGIPNNAGNVCLAGNIGRFVGPGQVMNSGTAGTFTLGVDLNALPTPIGVVAVIPGETWYFQAWYRDADPTSSSNFTDAVSISFY